MWKSSSYLRGPTPSPSPSERGGESINGVLNDAERTLMASEIRLPDIGDFKDVPIIEIAVKPGQNVAKDDILLTLESDKATLDVPAPEAGVIGEIKVKVGDKISQGDLLATYAGAPVAGVADPGQPRPAVAEAAGLGPRSATAATVPAPAPQSTDLECEVLVL